MTVQSSSKPKKLPDQLRGAIRIKHYSYSTEKTYVHWAKRYTLFHNKQHLAEMGAPEIEAFLCYLAQEGSVSSSTKNQDSNSCRRTGKTPVFWKKTGVFGIQVAEDNPNTQVGCDISNELNGTRQPVA